MNPAVRTVAALDSKMKARRYFPCIIYTRCLAYVCAVRNEFIEAISPYLSKCLSHSRKLLGEY